MATLQDLIVGFKTLYTDSALIQPDLNTLLLHKISLNSGGGGGGSSGTQYLEGLTESPATGTVLLFRRTDGTLKALQGDNSDRLKIVGDVTLSAGTSVNIGNFPATQAVSFGALPTGSNVIGSIANTVFAATQSGTWNLTNISGTISLPTGAATSAKQPALGTAGSPSTDVISIQGVSSGIAIKVNQDSNATTATITFTSSTTSSTFSIANRLALIVCPAVTGAPTLTLQVTLDGGTTWINTSITLTTDATNPKTIEADALAKVSGAFGLANAFRFSSSTSITSVTLNVRSITQ